MEEPGTYDVSDGEVPVTVTATLAAGYVFDPPLPTGVWVAGEDPGTAIYAVTLTQAPESCGVALPATVAVTQAVCADGEAPSTATVVLPAAQPGVTYDLTPPSDEEPGPMTCPTVRCR